MNVQMGGRTGCSRGELSLHLREIDLLVYRQALFCIALSYLQSTELQNSCHLSRLDNPEGVLWTIHSFPLKENFPYTTAVSSRIPGT